MHSHIPTCRDASSQSLTLAMHTCFPDVPILPWVLMSLGPSTQPVVENVQQEEYY